MCGIVGVVGRADEGVIQAMTRAIAHRGPDDEGTWMDQSGGPPVMLGSRRLAILDLSSAGHMPMLSDDGRYVIVYNGEVYNFRDIRKELEGHGHTFRSNTDTEVVLAAYARWGPECLSRFNGMFAMAIWDTAEKSLFLARDRFGKKPLFIVEGEGQIVFASEIKAVLADPTFEPALDPQSVWDYLVHRYVPGPHTMFRRVKKLLPGTYMLWRRNGCQYHSYYTPPDSRPPAERSNGKGAVGDFLEAFNKAVHLRLVSDAPLGAFLSGGIDSSAIVAMMSRHGDGPVNTYAVGFTESEYSELSHARMVADHFGTNHHELMVSAPTLMDHWESLIGISDAPVSEPANIPIYLLSREASKSVKVVLTGEGADEILGGYPKHRFEPFCSLYQAVIPELLHNNLVVPLVDSLPYGFRRIKTLVSNFGIRGFEDRMAGWFGALPVDEWHRLVAPGPPRRDWDPRPYSTGQGASPLRRMLFFDQTSWLPDNLLERGDRMTMAASIEARMPFLDHRMAQLISGYPDSIRIRGLSQKWVLRQAMKELLPAKILKRPKVGFRIPVNEWFRAPMRDFVADHLTGPSSVSRAMLEQKAVDRVLEEHVGGRKNHEKLIWTLVNLELFLKHFRLCP